MSSVSATPDPTYSRAAIVAMFRSAVAVVDRLLDERNQLESRRDLALLDHWQTMTMWGGVLRPACGRCRYGDGVSFLWPCPTRQALTGEAPPSPSAAASSGGES